MFGIQRFSLRLVGLMLGVVVGGVVLICALALAGCGTANGALAMKSSERQSDDSISFSGAEVVASIDPVAVIQAKTEAKVGEIRAREEKWRLLVWVLGVGVVLVAALALFIRSPLDRGSR